MPVCNSSRSEACLFPPDPPAPFKSNRSRCWVGRQPASTIDWTMSFRVTGGAMGVTATSAHCRHVCAPRHWMRRRGGCGCGLWSLGRILFWFLSRGFASVVRWWLYSSVNPKVFSKPIVKRINLGDETLHHASFWGVGTGHFVERWWRPGCGPSIHCCRLSKSPSDAN